MYTILRSALRLARFQITLWMLLAISSPGAFAAQTSGAAATQAPAAPSSSPSVSPSSSQQPPSRKDKRALEFIVTITLGGLGAGVRVFQRFRRFSGLGIFSNGYTWSFIGFTAVLAGAAFTGLSELFGAFALGGSMALPQIAGASIGHGLLAFGRLGRPGKKPVPPGDDSTPNDATAVNQLLDFFYTGVRIHVQERMHVRAKELARNFDFTTIRKVTCELIENEMDTSALSAQVGEKTIRKIKALSPSRVSSEDLNYDALRWTIVSSSYLQLKSRLESASARERG